MTPGESHETAWPLAASPPAAVRLRRLLAQGIRPDWVVVECWPPLWNASDPLIEENVIAENRLSAGDVWLLRHYWTRPRLLYQEWCQSRLSPWFSLRFVLMSHY